ncbi:hypothetical protein ACFL3N_00275, partial [Candidatus Omnitrophota bacterium]
YDDQDRLIKSINQDGSHTTYYADSARVESETFKEADSKGNMYYHYTDTELHLVDAEQRETADEHGDIAFEYMYITGTNTMKYEYSFTDIERTQRHIRYEYDSDGKLIKSASYTTDMVTEYSYYPSEGRLESIHSNAADETGNIYNHFMDNELNSKDITEREAANAEGEIAFEYTYHERSGALKYKYSYLDRTREQLYAAYEYDNNGNLIGAAYTGAGKLAVDNEPDQTAEEDNEPDQPTEEIVIMINAEHVPTPEEIKEVERRFSNAGYCSPKRTDSSGGLKSLFVK